MFFRGSNAGHDVFVESIATDEAVLVIDETGFLKQGNASCVVARQYTGIGRQNHKLPDRFIRGLCIGSRARVIDRALYLPKSWTGDPARLAATMSLKR
jgi:SRSO17 transposase